MSKSTSQSDTEDHRELMSQEREAAFQRQAENVAEAFNNMGNMLTAYLHIMSCPNHTANTVLKSRAALLAALQELTSKIELFPTDPALAGSKLIVFGDAGNSPADLAALITGLMQSFGD